MVARRRGVHCTPDQIVIVSGVQQAIDVIARLLIAPGDEVASSRRAILKRMSC